MKEPEVKLPVEQGYVYSPYIPVVNVVDMTKLIIQKPDLPQCGWVEELNV